MLTRKIHERTKKKNYRQECRPEFNEEVIRSGKKVNAIYLIMKYTNTNYKKSANNLT